jgi:oligoendopeptidase F
MKPCHRPILRLALAAGMLLAAPVFATERADVPERYKWRIADLYPTEQAWSDARADIAVRIPKVAAFQGRLGESADVFYTALSTYMDLSRDLARLSAYASLRADEDTRVAHLRELDQTASALGVQLGEASSYVTPEILALGAAKVTAFVAGDPRLEPYRPWLDDLLRYEAHTLSAAEEKVASQCGLMSDGPGRTYGMFTGGDLPYPVVTLSTGEQVRLDGAGYVLHRASPNREDRFKVFEAFWTAYLPFERTLGTTLDARVKTRVAYQRVHKFDSCLEDALFGSNIPVGVYRQLIADVHANLPTLHRYLGLRRRMMGLDTLCYQDLYAPIVREVDLRYTPEQAVDLVLQAVAPLGPGYVAPLKRGLESGWVDWMPSTGKRSGAYNLGVYGAHPYELLNFNGVYDDVTTLAHEGGHSMHSLLTGAHQPYVTSGYKPFVAEVASTLNENLLFHHMLDRTKDRDTRLFLLGSRLDDLRATLFRQTLFAEFELRIHELAEKDVPLTGERLSELYLGLLREYYGDAQGVCRVPDLLGVEWAFVSQFWTHDFYVYQYATSIVGSTTIAANLRAEAAARKPSTKTRDAYLAMLSAGGSRYPIDLLKDVGVDMTTPAPFRAAMGEMNSIMDEMEKLLK